MERKQVSALRSVVMEGDMNLNVMMITIEMVMAAVKTVRLKKDGLVRVDQVLGKVLVLSLFPTDQLSILQGPSTYLEGLFKECGSLISLMILLRTIVLNAPNSYG